MLAAGHRIRHRRGEAHAGVAGAGHAQPDSAASQPQAAAQAQAAAAAKAGGAPTFWQPQAQLLPGQLAQAQGEEETGFMAGPFGVERTRRVRGKGFCAAAFAAA
jgi:hypothetical protein